MNKNVENYGKVENKRKKEERKEKNVSIFPNCMESGEFQLPT